ncbi:uncharacterized protein LOC132265911 [Phlebotomus argentipes]|uniref:uncharacterized protein LOC132265911 n=1 Tax=Phlebotomus argentipes TaxID=94469 RepID=UPI0028934DD0|nr:uncharacterized protein LOC132265911 [Phlebotomus argentipes]
MSFQVLLILLSLATISRAAEVCLCCGEQVLKQDLKNCSDIARPASREEIDFLKNQCVFLQRLNSYPYDYNYHEYNYKYDDYKIATIRQFDVNSVNDIKIPGSNCDAIFNSLEGLLYMVPESNSDLFRYIKSSGSFYGSVQVDEIGLAVPGVFRTYNGLQDYANSIFTPFKMYEKSYKTQNATHRNYTRYVYFLRQPVSYKMTEIEDENTHFKPDWMVQSFQRYDPNEYMSLGRFSVCNDDYTNRNYTLSINYDEEMEINVFQYQFYPQLQPQLDIYQSQALSVLEYTDKDGDLRTVGLTKYHNEILYKTKAKISASSEETVEPFQCASAEVFAKWSTELKEAKFLIEINFGSLGKFKDVTEIKASGQIIHRFFSSEMLSNRKVSSTNNIIVIIPYNTFFFLIGCVVGMIVFCLLLLIVIKSMGFIDKRDFKTDWERTSTWTSTHFSTAAAFTKEKAEILGDRLVRLGDYLCNVGTWVYQEIK